MHTSTMLLTCPTYSPLAAMASQSIVGVAGTALFLAASVLQCIQGFGFRNSCSMWLYHVLAWYCILIVNATCACSRHLKVSEVI